MMTANNIAIDIFNAIGFFSGVINQWYVEAEPGSRSICSSFSGYLAGFEVRYVRFHMLKYNHVISIGKVIYPYRVLNYTAIRCLDMTDCRAHLERIFAISSN